MVMALDIAQTVRNHPKLNRRTSLQGNIVYKQSFLLINKKKMNQFLLLSII